MGKDSQWWDESWNPVTGCTPQSEGCEHCYAKAMHDRFYQSTKFEKVVLHPERLVKPSVSKPKVFFVDSMSDLFHEKVPFSFIGEVFDVMEKNAQHTFIILTKRSGRMLEFFAWRKFAAPDHVWVGVTAENQARAEERIPDLLKAPVKHRFVSIEPMLEKVNLDIAITAERGAYAYNTLTGEYWPFTERPLYGKKLDWVICGGETGSGGIRPMQIEWVRDLRDQCVGAEVPFFFKQWGAYRPASEEEKSFGATMVSSGRNFLDRHLDGSLWDQKPAELTPEPLRHGQSKEIYACDHGTVIPPLASLGGAKIAKGHGQVEVQLPLMGEVEE